jgi:hypothetical protein
MVSRKKQIAELKAKDEPTVVIGSHLTVITHPNGHTELIWDDEALARDVREAIASVENLTQGDSNVKTKKTRKSK